MKFILQMISEKAAQRPDMHPASGESMLKPP